MTRQFPPRCPEEWFGGRHPEHVDEALGAFMSGDVDTLVRLASEHPLPMAVVAGLTGPERARVGEAVSTRLTFTLRGGL
jgi:hypothetical protein